MPKGMQYGTEPSGAQPGQGAGPVSNAADVRKAKAPRGSAAEKIEANMNAGNAPRSIAPNTISKVVWGKVGSPSSNSANKQSRTP